MTSLQPIDPRAMTVDELMARHPETMAVFNAFGIDSCCGAHRSVHEAAAADEADEAALLDALTRAIGAGR